MALAGKILWLACVLPVLHSLSLCFCPNRTLHVLKCRRIHGNETNVFGHVRSLRPNTSSMVFLQIEHEPSSNLVSYHPESSRGIKIHLLQLSIYRFSLVLDRNNRRNGKGSSISRVWLYWLNRLWSYHSYSEARSNHQQHNDRIRAEILGFLLFCDRLCEGRFTNDCKNEFLAKRWW